MQFVDFFAGIGGIRLGLEQAGHKCVGFCEFDKYARTAYKAMYDTEGEWESHDVRATKPYDVPNADLWCFGFPCQDISVAGKQKGLQEGERSGLFYEIMRLLAGRRKEDRPRWLLVENVKNLLSIGNGFDFARLLCEVGGTGILSNGTLSTAKTSAFPKTGSACSLSAILEISVDEKYFLSDQQTARILANSTEITQGLSMAYRVYNPDGISKTLAAVGGGAGAKTGLYAVKVLKPYGSTGGTCGLKIAENKTGIASTCAARDYKGICRHNGNAVICVGNTNPCGHGQGGNVYSDKGIAPALTVAKSTPLQVCMSIKGQKLQKQIDTVPTIDTNCRNNLTRKQTCCAVLTPDRTEKRQNGRRIKEPGEPSFTLTAQDRHGVAIFDDQGRKNKQLKPMDICPTLRAQSHGNQPKVFSENIRIRRLTPRECWRLQGFPDEYFDKAKAAGISDTQLYKQAGNGVTVNVARAIGERLKEVEEHDE